MRREVAEQLIALNNRFYEAQAESFASTRHGSWRGWEHCVELLQRQASHASVLQDGEGPLAFSAALHGEGGDSHSPAAQPCFTVADIGAGSLRFPRYALSKGVANWRFLAVDNCGPLLEQGLQELGNISGELPLCHEEPACRVELIQRDVIRGALDGASALPEGTTADAAVCFGVLHHVPGFENRVQLLESLASHVTKGGLVVVSLWCFMRSHQLAERVTACQRQALGQCSMEAASLEPGDYLMGWDAQPGVWRYCHCFDQEEIQRMVEAVAPCLQLAERWCADGRTGNLNEYLALRVAR